MNCITTKSKDLINIIKCHKSAFPNALSSKMGTPFILKMMEWYVTSERGILFHIENKNNEIIGYCGGIVTKQKNLHGAVTSITQYAFNTILVSYLIRPWLFFHPENLKKITSIKKNILIKLGLHKTVESINKQEFRPFMGLVVIGLKKEYQGKGTGSILLNEFERRAKNDIDIDKISLSVKPSNLNAIKSYSKNGWETGKQTKTSIEMYKLL